MGLVPVAEATVAMSHSAGLLPAALTLAASGQFYSAGLVRGEGKQAGDGCQVLFGRETAVELGCVPFSHRVDVAIFVA